MSLKYFHVFFIATTLGLMAFLAYWSQGHVSPDSARRGAVLASLGGMALDAGYLGWFLRRYRNLQ